MQEENPDRSRLIQLLKDRSVAIGDFTLSSGRRSKYYVDARTTTMSALGLQIIGKLGLSEIRSAGWEASAVGGLTLGADPVAYAISLASLDGPSRLDAFTVRKDAKKHGTGKQIEGCFESGSRVVVIEDVITTGGSALKAIEAVEAAKGIVTGILAVVDRGEGGREAIVDAGYEVRSLVRLPDLA